MSRSFVIINSYFSDEKGSHVFSDPQLRRVELVFLITTSFETSYDRRR